MNSSLKPPRHRSTISPRLAGAFVAALILAGCANTPRGSEPGAATTPTPSTSAPIPPSVPTPAAAPVATASAPLPAADPASGAATAITPGVATLPDMAKLPPEVDLWARIRQGFAMPQLDTDLVRAQEQWYSSRPEYIGRMTERSRKYLYHVVEELERRGMPTELALLPFIESAFNPQAVSSARAAGMWQFMPATGSDYALKRNVFRDDRRDVLASTRAALDYLQKLHGMFGDWHLALAAYNWGEGSVGRAIKKNQRDGLGTSYLELSMPNETRNYVPKLQAVKNIVANPENFRAELPVIDNHPYFQSVAINRDIDVALAARLADVKLDDFKALNPSMHRPVILAAGTPQILLPWDNAKVFQRNFEAYTAGQYASWTAWSAPATMSVADAARRNGMQESDLRSINNIPPRMLIKAGSVLIVPRDKRMTTDVSTQVADNGQLALAPEIVTRRATVKAGRRDSVASIAGRYRVSPAQVAEWNGLKAGAALRPGQAVTLFLPMKAGARSTGRGARSAAAPRGGRATATRGVKASRAAAGRVVTRPVAAPRGKKRR